MNELERLRKRERDLFTVEEVAGNDVSGNLGEIDFGRRKITVPGFKKLPLWFRKRNGGIISAIKDYILGHELKHAEFGRPVQGYDHSMLELDYLETLREEGRWLPYLAGLAVHKLRLKYGDRTGFSTDIADYVEERLSRYAKQIKEIEPVIDEALKPAYA